MSTQSHETDSQSNVKTFNKDSITLTLTQLPDCQVKFDITVKPEAVLATKHSAFKAVSKNVSIPGFRKGKAPDNFVKEKFKSQIESEWKDAVINQAFYEATDLAEVYPLKNGIFKRPKIHKFSEKDGAEFTLEFETEPNVPEIDLNDLVLKKQHVPAITEEDKENALYNTRLRLTTYDPIEDRGAQEDDFVNFSVSLLVDPERLVIDNQRSQMNTKGLPSWLFEKMKGLKAEEQAEGMTEPGVDSEDPDSKPVPYRVTVHSIWKGNVPEVDDEFAKKVGLETVDEIYQKITERLEKAIEQETADRNFKELKQLLQTKYPYAIPKSIIDSEVDYQVTQHLEKMARESDEYNEKEIEQAKNFFEQNARDQLHFYFLMRKFARGQEIIVTMEDTNKELQKQVELMMSGGSRINFQMSESELKEQIQNIAYDSKVRKLLLDHVRFVD